MDSDDICAIQGYVLEIIRRGSELEQIFQDDVKVKLNKLKFKCKLEKSLLEELGGINSVTLLTDELSRIFQMNDDFFFFQTSCPEENPSLIKSVGQNNYGLNFLEYFFSMYFSEYDCHAIEDCKSGILSLQISQQVPIQWKLAMKCVCVTMKMTKKQSRNIL